MYALSVVGLNLDMVGIDERVVDGLAGAAPFSPAIDSEEVRGAAHG